MAYQPVPSGVQLEFAHSPFGDTTYTKVFIGGLAWETRSEALHRHFEQFGEILEAVVITEKNSGRSKGYGFVTFQDPESAWRACADPTPVIDGRRTNCNLASLGRPQLPLFYGHLRPVPAYGGGVHATGGTHLGSIGYQQPASYSFQHGHVYPPHGYTTTGPEYIMQPGVYNSYMGQQYLQMYGDLRPVNASISPYGQGGPFVLSGHGYTTIQRYAIPGHRIMQYTGPSVYAIPNSSVPAIIQAPYPAGIPPPIQSQPSLLVPAPTPQFIRAAVLRS
ncbi:hypothetical protein BT93_H0707 [Corymbia citriodora subsp. variegata]|nr:hypothetical protein BT93_H0707 [Corymbia citriodora subsp. variegata]KAF8014994.1 hypothetical protein BT93_H0707 [Corymbia citriodora subsp. variegata]KAF8014995.1 hypothetical protein BT93_H0707 [Corymbia citriodora subsp. variegata]KAF8014996.1 hypothetical protein BT93_H0707 [Corymbia citriodora subsp. variegata]KAF8014997.1 hypothetical protein BT93_H0707 [Corymbia citriodora subsp. variegata]